ncbi:MAG TPA: EamA family transporter [candidate division WOR-3 bacterium]|uniref:EamA family transporter n=1 Tax=candidate division WOR-3 bacterium TaxID=2052148 RepID=A0A9C9EKV7_UNCW3|nr:EamA family transporter [candidate division WOR-3 bacterium]
MNTYFGEIAALGTAFCWSFGSVFFTISSRAIGHNTVNRLRLLLGFILLSLTHYFITGYLFPHNVTATHWVWFGASGVIGFVIGDTLLLRSFVPIGPRLSMLMMSLVPVFSTLIAWLFLKEILHYTDIIAILTTLLGISIVILARNSKDINRADKTNYGIGLLCGIGGAVGQAVGLLLSKKGLNTGFSPLSGNILRIFVAVVVIYMVDRLDKRPFENNRKFYEEQKSRQYHGRWCSARTVSRGVAFSGGC